MLTLAFAPFGPRPPDAIFVPPPGMRLQEYVLAYDEGRRRTVYLAAHDHGAAFGDAYLFDGAEWTKVAEGKTVFATAQKLFGFYDEARAGVAAWSFARDFKEKRVVATSLLFDVRNGLSPIVTRGDSPVAEPPEGVRVGTFDYHGLFAPDPVRAVTVCVTRRGVWELDADAVWRKRASHDPSFPAAWDEDGAGATFDPVRRRAVFWVFTRAPERAYAFFVWDGKTLTRISDDGLPTRELTIGLSDPAALIGAHPRHGVVLVAGSRGAFAFDGARWNALPSETGEPPPRMKNARMTFDANAGGLIVGPGYHEGDPGGREQQPVFYVEKNGAWTRLGSKSMPSELAEIERAHHVWTGGAWTAVGRRLETIRWTERGFEKVVSKNDGAAIALRETVEAVVAANGRALAIGSRGSVFALADASATWTRARGAHRAFGERHDFSAAWDGGRVVVSGGLVKGRPTSETLFFVGDTWRAAKSSASEGAPKADEPVDVVLAWDGARVLRLGHREIAALDGDVWHPFAAHGYAAFGGARAWERFPVCDPATGETLLVNLASGAIARLDAERCVEIARLELPTELAPKRQHDEAAYVALAGSLAFDPAARLLHAQDPAERARRYALDLGPAFDAAAALGPRAVFAPASVVRAVHLHHPKKLVHWSGDDPKAIAAKRRAGFVEASELSLSALAALGTRPSRAITIGKTLKTTKAATSHLFGSPPAPLAKRWPKRGTAPLGFLAQIDARGILRKHAGVAIFVVTDGTGTEDASNNVAILLRATEWRAKPAAPAGAPTLPPRSLVLARAKPEIDEARVRALAADDPAMTAAFDAFQRKAKVQTPTASKRGGAPLFVQARELFAEYTFFAQLDLDGVPDASRWGLAGCVYVFVSNDEKSARVFWQQT
ncbi:MAG TPA: hypothetical protein VGH28_13370 [Polyangiaceae bacterium]